MESSEFKRLFSKVSEKSQFVAAFSGWFKEFSDTLIVLDLQKSNYGNYFELNIKIFVQGLFGNSYAKGKDLVKQLPGDVFLRAPNSFRDILNLDFDLSLDEREHRIEKLFADFIIPFSEEARTRSGLLRLAEMGKVVLLPVVQEELIKSI